MNSQYDVIVIGNNLSTALCAALLAQSGKKVLFVDHTNNNTALQEVSIGSDLYLNLYPNVKVAGILNKALQQLDAFHEDDFIANPEVMQIVGPDFRVTLFSDVAATVAELKREFTGAQYEDIKNYFEVLSHTAQEIPTFVNDVYSAGQNPAVYVNQWKRTLSQVLPVDRLGHQPVGFDFLKKFSPELCRLLTVPFTALGSYSCPYAMNLEQGIRFAALGLQGLHHFQGGSREFLKKLYQCIERYGGTIKTGARVQSLVTSNQKITGVLLSTYEGVIYSSIVVLGADHLRLYRSLPISMVDKATAHDLASVEATHWRFSIFIEIPKNALPAGIAHTVSYITHYDMPLEEENFLMLQAEPKGDQYLLRVTALVPLRPSFMEYRYLQKLSGRILHRLDALIPFLSKNMLKLTPDFRHSTQELERIYPFYSTPNVIEGLKQYYVRGEKEMQAFTKIPWSTPHENLFFCGPVVWPSLGTYGDILSAWKIYESLNYVRLS